MSITIDLLRHAFNEIDPAGVFFEDNVDEYDPEINELLKSNIDMTDISQLKNELSRIFETYFEGIKIEREKINALGVKIQSIAEK